tara:strand:+ start:160 stop:1101 length:942 start_codon:yes stop_codon:yes gene_type:complete
MNVHPVLLEISKDLIKNPNKHEAHKKITPLIQNLCNDMNFIREALKIYLSNPKSLEDIRNNTITLLSSGDLIFAINIFCPLRDGAKNITSDNIHHHGWRLLSTGIISGDGYDTINFVKNTHMARDNNEVKLKIKEVYRHRKGEVRFIDSNTAHVVFHPKKTCATLAIWSADRIITSQGVKRKLAEFPSLRKVLTKTVHAMRLNELFRLNPLKGLYYHPEGGRIVETKNYSKPEDGSFEEIIHCWFIFFQQINFNDHEFWEERKKTSPKQVSNLIEKLISGDTIKDIGIWGNLRRRFSKTQILQAIDNSILAKT